MNMKTNTDNKTLHQDSMQLAYVGCVVPDKAEFRTNVFCRAGNMFQTNLLTSIRDAGISVSTVISCVPIQSWPNGCQVFSKSANYRLEDGTSVDSVSFVNIPLLKQLMIGLAVLRKLLIWGWRNRKCRSRVVSTFNLTAPPGIFTLLGARLIGAKAVAHLYDINVPGETVPWTPLFRLDYKLHRLLMPRFDGLVVVSDAIIRDFGLRAPHIRVEGGVRESLFSTVSPRCDSTGFVVVSAGSLDEPNGLRVLLEAFSKLRGDHYRLRIAGAGPLENEVRSAAARDARIEYCGFLAFNDVLRLYASADVLINMRLTKSVNTKYFFPSKLMEYLASGRPVISTCTGHVEEELGRYLYLLKDETPQGLADLLVDIEGQGFQIREEKGTTARDYMLANKTWSAQGSRIASFIRSLVAQK